ncbi:MAG: methylenetetrahydrofolate reductase [Oscillospiraceae bacterium]|jgi:methylenetetrahydrofolate reductase (NADPH)|nr:methylenetetrahydrofolate reductase [Oscillospiraceae bacterium]
MSIRALYRSGRPVVSFEVFPPKQDTGIDDIYEALAQLAALAPDFISVTYGAGGSGSVNRTAEITAAVRRRYGIRAMAHLTCVGAERGRVAAQLDAMRAEGVRNVLALRGDDSEGARPGAYRHAEDLIREIRARGGFCIGAACYPEGHIDCESPARDIEYLRRKQDAGADFLIGQLCFDNNLFFGFLERARAAGVTVPISAGVMPILGRRQIERMIFLCGASLPSEIIKLLHRHAHSPADLRAAGIERAAGQVEALLAGGVDGVHIYTMNKPEIASTCMTRIGRV